MEAGSDNNSEVEEIDRGKIMTKLAIVSDADKIKEALYERSNGTLIATDDDVKKFQECQAAGFSFESAVGLFFQVKAMAEERASRGAAG